jgi:hypothetical protein
LKAERRQPPYAIAIRKGVADVGKDPARIGQVLAWQRVFEHGDQSGARVLGIHIDGARLQRGEDELGAAEPGEPLDRDAAAFQELGEHLSEHIGLAKGL